MRSFMLTASGVIFGAALTATATALAVEPTGFAQQVPNIGTIINENGKAVHSLQWTDLDCSSGGVIKIRRTAELGAQSVQEISVIVTCGRYLYHERLNGFIEGVDIHIPSSH